MHRSRIHSLSRVLHQDTFHSKIIHQNNPMKSISDCNCHPHDADEYTKAHRCQVACGYEEACKHQASIRGFMPPLRGSGTDVCIPVPRIQRLCTAIARYCLRDKCFGSNYWSLRLQETSKMTVFGKLSLPSVLKILSKISAIFLQALWD